MMQMSSDQLKSVCYVNKYAQKLCYGTNSNDFWIRKFKYEQLLLPNKNLLINVDWLKSYDVLNSITTYMLDSSIEDKSVAVINKNVKDLLLDLLEKYNFIDDKYSFRSDYNYLNSIVFWKNNPDVYYINFIGANRVQSIQEQILVNFLFEAMMANMIIKLTG